MEILLHGTVLENCRSMGAYFMQGLESLKQRYPSIIKVVRGKGLIIGMELNIEGKEIVSTCLKQGIIINCTLDKILRFLPPLIVKKQEIDRCLKMLESIFAKL